MPECPGHSQDYRASLWLCGPQNSLSCWAVLCPAVCFTDPLEAGSSLHHHPQEKGQHEAFCHHPKCPDVACITWGHRISLHCNTAWLLQVTRSHQESLCFPQAALRKRCSCELSSGLSGAGMEIRDMSLEVSVVLPVSESLLYSTFSCSKDSFTQP